MDGCNGITRDLALGAVRRLASGLRADDAGVRRLLERIAAQDDAEALRDALTELGAQVILDREARP